jgi:hypothetical protein
MATPSVVVVDNFSPLIQRLLEDFEATYLPDGCLESQERSIKREYIKYAKIPFISGLMDRVLSGDWGWGTTQREVGEELGLDRSRLSDALRKGEMSIDTFIAIWFAGTRPSWRIDEWNVAAAMKRSGFMAVARHLAGFVHDRPTLKPNELNELRHELLCSIFGNYLLWNRARLGGHTMVASDAVETVCSDNSLGIVPGWYTQDQESEVRALIANLRSSAPTAMLFLCRLQDDWEDIYVATAQATEEIHLRF